MWTLLLPKKAREPEFRAFLKWHDLRQIHHRDKGAIHTNHYPDTRHSGGPLYIHHACHEPVSDFRVWKTINSGVANTVPASAGKTTRSGQCFLGAFLMLK